MNPTYILTDREFAALCAGNGISECIYFHSEQMEDGDREDSIRALFQLTRRHLMEVSEEGIRPSGEMRELFSVIRDADTLLVVTSKEDAVPPACVYIRKNDAAVLFPDAYDRNTCRISRTNTGDLAGELRDLCGLPEGVAEGKELFVPIYKEHAMSSYPDTGALIRIESRDPETDTVRQVLEYAEHPERTELVFSEEDTVSHYLFAASVFEKCLRRMTTGSGTRPDTDSHAGEKG